MKLGQSLHVGSPAPGRATQDGPGSVEDRQRTRDVRAGERPTPHKRRRQCRSVRVVAIGHSTDLSVSIVGTDRNSPMACAAWRYDMRSRRPSRSQLRQLERATVFATRLGDRGKAHSRGRTCRMPPFSLATVRMVRAWQPGHTFYDQVLPPARQSRPCCVSGGGPGRRANAGRGTEVACIRFAKASTPYPWDVGTSES